MTPERSETIADYLIEEYYWAGDLVVYINAQRSPATFDGAVAWAKKRVTADEDFRFLQSMNQLGKP